MNRDMYLSSPWFDEDVLSVDTNHLQKLNKQFENSLELFFSKL